MSTADDELERRLWQLGQGRADTSVAVCEDVDFTSGMAAVAFVSGVRQSMPWSGPAPWPGEKVRVVNAGGSPFCQLIQGAPIGTVLTTSAGVVTVDDDDGNRYRYPHLGSAPANGARVRIDHAGRCVVGVYAAEPAGTDYVPPPPPPGPGTQTRDFLPIDSANWRGGAWQDQGVEISSSDTPRSGFYFYGTQIADSIPDSAQVTSCVLLLAEEWDRVPGVPSKLGMHGVGWRPAVPPVLSGAIDVYDGGAINIIAFADALKAGTQYGIGFAAGYGWRRFAPYTVSGAIRVTWTN